MLANLLSVAGVQHVVTVDLHVSDIRHLQCLRLMLQAAPMQGFFGKPVDNLHAEPLIARWIRNHVADWKEAVVVSKNPGGTKRVTSLADALKLNFGIVTTDRRRSPVYGGMSMEASLVLPPLGDGINESIFSLTADLDSESDLNQRFATEENISFKRDGHWTRNQPINTSHPAIPSHRLPGSSPLVQSTRVESESPPTSRSRLQRSMTAPVSMRSTPDPKDMAEEFTDERAREVITGRLIQGHIVDDDYPSPILSTMSGSVATLPGELGPSQFEDRDPMASSFVSAISSHQQDHALGGTYDAAESDEEEEGFKNPELEHTITLVGNVKDKTVFIIDDMIDRSGSWVAAAETVVKRGDAKKVYCIATHGLFDDESLDAMENCECIDHIVVSNTFPIAPGKMQTSRKLVVLDLSGLLAEAIRRTHFGESISSLYQHYQD